MRGGAYMRARVANTWGAHPVDMEYFWLGRIPCRTVELVGVLVGIQVYEQRIVYACELRPLFYVDSLEHRRCCRPNRAKTIDCDMGA